MWLGRGGDRRCGAAAATPSSMILLEPGHLPVAHATTPHQATPATHTGETRLLLGLAPNLPWLLSADQHSLAASQVWPGWAWRWRHLMEHRTALGHCSDLFSRRHPQGPGPRRQILGVLCVTALCEMSSGREFPGGPVVRTRRFHCRGPGSIPGQGTKIPTSRATAK